MGLTLPQSVFYFVKMEIAFWLLNTVYAKCITVHYSIILTDITIDNNPADIQSNVFLYNTFFYFWNISRTLFKYNLNMYNYIEKTDPDG